MFYYCFYIYIFNLYNLYAISHIYHIWMYIIYTLWLLNIFIACVIFIFIFEDYCLLAYIDCGCSTCCFSRLFVLLWCHYLLWPHFSIVTLLYAAILLCNHCQCLCLLLPLYIWLYISPDEGLSAEILWWILLIYIIGPNTLCRLLYFTHGVGDSACFTL